MKLRIVCAANKYGDITVLGVRHFDELMQKQINQLDGPCYGIDWSKSEQGFIDSKGRFLNRQKAWKIAQASGQIIKRVGGDTTDGGTLFSENLY